MNWIPFLCECISSLYASISLTCMFCGMKWGELAAFVDAYSVSSGIFVGSRRLSFVDVILLETKLAF